MCAHTAMGRVRAVCGEARCCRHAPLRLTANVLLVESVFGCALVRPAAGYRAAANEKSMAGAHDPPVLLVTSRRKHARSVPI